jgi:hypothetical protein
MPYTAEKPRLSETPEQLRARIPGWGVDQNPADRPAVPRLQRGATDSGAHWDFPERQEDTHARERSIEHAHLTPVFGTAQPLKGMSGAIRRQAYQRFSEGRAAHWLLLMVGDRVDVLESRVTGLLTGKPDGVVSETGVSSELSYHGLSSRRGHRRSDVTHHWMDPAAAAPWVAAGVGAAVLALVRRRRGR